MIKIKKAKVELEISRDEYKKINSRIILYNILIAFSFITNKHLHFHSK